MKPNRSKLSAEAQIVWDSLMTNEERLVIRKEYPLKRKRNALIKKLKMKGVRIVVLSEISGLSDSSIDEIVSKTGDVGRASLDDEYLRFVKELKRHKGIFGRLYEISNS